MRAKMILLKTAAASAVIMLGTTTVASAYHRYEDQWADAALTSTWVESMVQPAT